MIKLKNIFYKFLIFFSVLTLLVAFGGTSFSKTRAHCHKTGQDDKADKKETVVEEVTLVATISYVSSFSFQNYIPGSAPIFFEKGIVLISFLGKQFVDGGLTILFTRIIPAKAP